MADTATFAIKLDDGVSGASEAAAGALDKMRQKIEADQKALRALEAAMKNLNKGTVVNIQAHKSLAAQIEAKRNAIAGATHDFLALGGSFNKHPPKPIPKETGESLDRLARATKKLGLTAPDDILDFAEAIGTLPGLLVTA